MRDYFMSLIIAAIIGTVLSSLAGGTFEKYMKYIVALICIMILILPLKAVVNLTLDFDELTNTESPPTVSGSESYIVERSKQRIESAVAEAVEKQFKIQIHNVKANIRITDVSDGGHKRDIIVDNIDVWVEKSDALRIAEIKSYLFNMLGVEINVYSVNEDVSEGI